MNPTTRYIQKDKEYWTFLLNDIIIPLIRELTKNVFQKPLQELLINTAGLFNDYFSYNYNLLEKYFDAVSNVICSGSEICNSGLECLKYIVGIERMKNMQFLHCFITLLLNVINRTLPKKLITLNHKEFLNPEKPNSTENLNSFVTDCYILFSVLELIKELIPKSLIVIVDDDINLLLESLENVYTICFKFNSNIELRIAFTKYLQNCMELNQIAVLFKHQRISIEIYFEILITIYGYNSNDARKEFCFKKIMDSSVILLQWFVELNNDLIGDEEQEIEYEKASVSLKLASRLLPPGVLVQLCAMRCRSSCAQASGVSASVGISTPRRFSSSSSCSVCGTSRPTLRSSGSCAKTACGVPSATILPSDMAAHRNDG